MLLLQAFITSQTTSVTAQNSSLDCIKFTNDLFNYCETNSTETSDELNLGYDRFATALSPFSTVSGYEGKLYTTSLQYTKSPGQALLRSFVMPGWGHYYADSGNWRRGQIHLGTEAVLLTSIVYLFTNANMLENNMFTHATAFAGIDLRNVPRNVEIAVGSAQSLSDYNENQLRTRNWDRLIDDIPENRWQWEDEAKRGEYLRIRDRMDRNRQQIPGVVTLMAVNRLISGIHSFIVTRNLANEINDFSLQMESGHRFGSDSGVVATFSYRF